MKTTTGIIAKGDLDLGHREEHHQVERMERPNIVEDRTNLRGAIALDEELLQQEAEEREASLMDDEKAKPPYRREHHD